MFDWRSLAELERETEVAVVVADDGGCVVRVNAAFAALFGWSEAEIVGRPLTVIMPEAMREAHLKGFARLLATGAPQFLNQTLRLPAVSRSGREFIAEHFIMGENRSGRWAFGAAIREILPRADAD